MDKSLYFLLFKHLWIIFFCNKKWKVKNNPLSLKHFHFFTSCNLWASSFYMVESAPKMQREMESCWICILNIMQTPEHRPDNRAAGWFMEMHLLHCRCLSVTEVADIPTRGRKSSYDEFRCRQGQWKQSASSCGPQLTRLRWSCEQSNFDNHTHTHTYLQETGLWAKLLE